MINMKYSELPNKICGIYKKDLLNPNLSIQDISNKYQCDRSTIGDINQGKRYSNKEESYPIRNFYPNRGSKKPVSTILGTEE